MEQGLEAIDFDKSLGPWLGKTVKMVDFYLQESLRQAGLDLTKEQMIILKKLHEHDGLNQNELAELTYRDKSSMARLLSKMEAKQYVKKRQQKDDKRVNEVFLTKEGRQIFKNSRPVIKALIEEMEAGVSKREKKAVIGILKKIQHNYRKRNLAAVPHPQTSV